MQSFNNDSAIPVADDDIIVSGLGVTSSIGQGKQTFFDALIAGEHRFDVMRREGRQMPDGSSAYLGAEISDIVLPENAPRRELRTASLSAKIALATLHEAWHDAQLDSVDPTRIGLVIGGSNIQQRELLLTHEKHHDNPDFVRPTYAMSYMDTDLVGLCTQTFNILGMAYSLGSASASGQACVIQAIEAVRSGQVDVCIAMGAMMDLSYWECQGFRSLGAMGSEVFAESPELACRPFDRDRNGFIFGENCAAIVIERVPAQAHEAQHNMHHADANRQHIEPYAKVAGWGMAMDGNRNPDPSFDGEVRVIEQALQRAGLHASDIDYVNPHGTGSTIGDETELKAITHCGLEHAWLNATKSIVGHGLSAAGSVEIAATLLQMRYGKLHGTRNLDNPISTSHHWVREFGTEHHINYALKMSMGFGGVNTAICFKNLS